MSQYDEEPQPLSDDDDYQVLCCGKYDRKPGMKLITLVWSFWTLLLLAFLTIGIIQLTNVAYLDILIALVNIYALCILINTLQSLDSNSVVEDEALRKSSQSLGIALAVFIIIRIAQVLWICFDEQSSLPGVEKEADWQDAKLKIWLLIIIESVIMIPLTIYFVIITRRWSTQFEDSYQSSGFSK